MICDVYQDKKRLANRVPEKQQCFHFKNLMVVMNVYKTKLGQPGGIAGSVVASQLHGSGYSLGSRFSGFLVPPKTCLDWLHLITEVL